MIVAAYVILNILLGTLFVTFLWKLYWALKHFRIRKKYMVLGEAPSVSVCVPARNETHAMTQCLERVLASDYPKMEVVVFDDESADDTSVLINSFAHAGVRFVPGTTLPEGWLGKNHALEVLAREASGTYIIFLDVDTHIQPNTISQLVEYVTSEELQMVSVIPGRNDAWRPSVLFGHLRYYWELIFTRESSPATASSLWMIKRRTLLNTIGGFSSHRAEVEPESRMAAIIGTKAYHCLINDKNLGVTYEKRWLSQRETSRRLLYPMAGGTVRSGVLGLAILLLLNIPFLFVVSGLFMEWSIAQTMGLAYLVLFSGLYACYTYAIWGRNWWAGVVVWPIVVAHELVMFIESIVGYARGTITWKGRPVLSPKMAKQVQPQAPSLNI